MSEVIARVVATRELKGKTMVRKINAWRRTDGNYVVFFLDYSPNRAESTNVTVKVTSSEEQASRMIEKLKEEQFKRGWNVSANHR